MPEHILTPKIQQPCPLVSPIPLYLESDGVWLDPLWHHDLIGHLTYLQHSTLLAPRSSLPRPSASIRLSPPSDVQFRAVPIPELNRRRIRVLATSRPDSDRPGRARALLVDGIPGSLVGQPSTPVPVFTARLPRLAVHARPRCSLHHAGHVDQRRGHSVGRSSDRQLGPEGA